MSIVLRPGLNVSKGISIFLVVEPYLTSSAKESIPGKDIIILYYKILYYKILYYKILT